MAFYFSVNLDNERTLCVAPLTDRRIAMAGVDVSDPSGYFLYESRESEPFGGVEILAKVFSEEAALRLRDMFKMT